MNQTAQGLAALGRGPDTQLVHMAPSEVKSLQQLAMAHGGSLSINPQTGLPEAGFLSSILPMVIGAGITAATGGAAAPWMIGLGVGGVQAARTGSLEKGLMAGLGAYGGAGLADGLFGAGTGALSSAAGAGAPQVAAESLVPQAIAPSAAQATSGMTPDMLARGAAEGARGTGADLLTSGLQMPPATFAAQAVPTVTPTLSQAELVSQAMQSQQAALLNDQAAAQAVGSRLASATPMQTAGAGLEAAYNAPGAFLKANKYPLGAAGISLLAGMQPDAPNASAEKTGLIRPYTYSREKIPGAFQDVAGAPMSSRERRYFTDSYTAGTPYAAPGPEYKTMASGGPVEEMSNANAIGANTGYPQSGIRTSAYATPFQQPMGQNMVTGAQDVSVDPYTGQEQRTAPAPQAQFADGGSIGGYTYDPVSQTYSTASGQGITTVKPPGFNVNNDRMSDTNVPAPGMWDNMTDQQKADFYRDNPLYAAVTQLGQKAFGLTFLADLQEKMMPGFQANQRTLTYGYTPADFGVNATRMGAMQDDLIADTEGARAAQQANSSYGTGVGNPGESYGGGNQSGNESTAGEGTGDGGAGSGGGRSAGDARGGFYNHGKFDQRPQDMAAGGISNLGDYSDGGRLLRGPGDGISDSIPAVIGQKRPARLADGEFVVPARIVSELGNGSTEAGARKLYAMMERVQKARGKTVGRGKVAANSRASKHLPA